LSEGYVYSPFSIRADSSKPARIVQDPEGKLWLQYYDLDGQLRQAPLSLIIFPQELGNLKDQIPVQDFFQSLRVSIVDKTFNVLEGTVKKLDSVSISASGTSEFTLSGVSKYSAVIATVRASYNASATQGVRVRWLYSADNVSYDGVEDAEDAGNYEDLTFSAGATRQRTIVIPLLQPYTKVQVVNKDTSYSVTVSCWTSFMR